MLHVDLHSNLRLGPIRVRSGTEIAFRASRPHALFYESASPMKQRPVHPALPRHHKPWRRPGSLWRDPDRQVPCPSGDDLPAGSGRSRRHTRPHEVDRSRPRLQPRRRSPSRPGLEGVNDGTMRRNEVLDRVKGLCAWYRLSVREPKRDTTISDNHSEDQTFCSAASVSRTS
jgi:hypothetical protein